MSLCRESKHRHIGFQRAALTNRLSRQIMSCQNYYTTSLPYYQSTRVTMQVWNWLWFVICKRYKITSILVKEWRLYLMISSNIYQTNVKFIPILAHVLIDRSVKKMCKSFNNVSLIVPIVKLWERHTGKQGVAGSIPCGGIHFHFEFFVYFPFHTARQSLYKMKLSMTFFQRNWCKKI